MNLLTVLREEKSSDLKGCLYHQTQIKLAYNTNRIEGSKLSEEQTRYIQNIAYLRMKNIQFGYNLPLNLISKIKAQNVKIYFSGENLLTWSPLYKYSRDLDVESTGPSDQLFTSSNAGDGYNYPMMKNVTVGISVTF